MFTIFFAAIITLYILELALLYHGLMRSSGHPAVQGYVPMVSVIVAARNEERNIRKCLDSLSQVEYPRDRLEVVIVNDSSTDRTSEIARDFVAGHKHMTLLNAPPESGNLRGKTNAVTHGIGNSRGEIIMFTDADCVVNPLWISATVRHFDPSSGIVGGFTILNGGTVFTAIQSLDWLYLFGVACATAGLGQPLTAIGNNLAVRREAYEQAGGYEAIPFSVTEDYSLVQAILQKTPFRLKFPVSAGSIVKSDACRTLADLYHQKQRWGVGAIDMVPAGYFVIILGWLVRVVLLAALFALPAIPLIAGALGIILADYLFLGKLIRFFRIGFLRRYFLPFEVYFTLYGLIIPFLAFGSRNVIWKERSLRSDKKNAPTRLENGRGS